MVHAGILRGLSTRAVRSWRRRERHARRLQAVRDAVLRRRLVHPACRRLDHFPVLVHRHRIAGPLKELEHVDYEHRRAVRHDAPLGRVGVRVKDLLGEHAGGVINAGLTARRELVPRPR